MIRLLMIGNEVIGYGKKKIVKKFKSQYPKISLVEKTLPNIPEEYEYQLNFKEFYIDPLSDKVTNEYLLAIAEQEISELAYRLKLTEKWLLDFMEYVKMDEHERDDVFHLYYHVRSMEEDISPQDDSLVGFTYNDYVNTDSIIESYLKG